MILDWGKPWKPFPTTEGVDPGRANKRTMLDAMGGADTIKKRFQDNQDGSVTMAHTRGPGSQPEFITKGVKDTLAKFSVSMDSGTIDMRGVGVESPYRFSDGVLHYGSNQDACVVAQQLLGSIKPPSLENKTPPLDGSFAKSFSVVQGTLGVRSEEDQFKLWAKKLCLGQVPPSLFCGKARLYAQALYGADLNDWSWMAVLGGAPAIQSYGGVLLSTNSGVYTDDEHRHWLLTLSGESISITHLKAAAKVEPLRKLLTLAGVDHDRVEAYILAYSTPDPLLSFVVDVQNAPGEEMFGYGWKFNWDGTKADKIVTETYETGEGASVENRSTHFRVSVSRSPGLIGSISDERSKWSATLSTVEGPVTWKNSKWTQVIASPSWGESQLFVFGDLWGRLFGDAPIYCFYKRNTLEVIRYTNNNPASGVMYAVESSPVCWMGRHDWTVDNMDSYNYYSLGFEPADGRRKTRTQAPEITGFYSSLFSTVTTCENYTYQGRRLSASLGSVNTWYNYDWPVCEFDPNSYEVVEEFFGYSSDGVPRYGGRLVLGTELPAASYPCRWYRWSTASSVNCVEETYTGTHSEGAYTVLVVPFYDSEAVYYWSQKDTSYSEAVTTNTATATYGGAHTIQWFDESNTLLGEWHGLLGGPVPPTGVVTTDNTSSSASTQNNGLSTTHDLLPFSPPHSMSMFFAGEPVELIPQTFTTYTSCEGAVFGHGAENTLGFTFKTSPFIGWA